MEASGAVIGHKMQTLPCYQPIEQFDPLVKLIFDKLLRPLSRQCLLFYLFAGHKVLNERVIKDHINVELVMWNV